MKRHIIIGSLLLLGGFLTWHFIKQARLAKDYCFQLTGHKVKNISFKEILVDLFLTIKNKSKLAVTLDSVNLEITVNGRVVSKINSTNKQSIKEQGYSIITLPLVIQTKDVLGSALSLNAIKGALLDKTKLKVGIKGTIGISHLNLLKISDIPIDVNTTLAEIESSEVQEC